MEKKKTKAAGSGKKKVRRFKKSWRLESILNHENRMGMNEEQLVDFIEKDVRKQMKKNVKKDPEDNHYRDRIHSVYIKYHVIDTKYNETGTIEARLTFSVEGGAHVDPLFNIKYA